MDKPTCVGVCMLGTSFSVQEHKNKLEKQYSLSIMSVCVL